jgi:toluene monooxygenase system ferredoxin subunit
MTFRKASHLDELWSGEMAAVTIQGRAVLLVHVGGQVRAFEDRCVHQAVPLSVGRLRDHTLTCSAHEWEYDATTGRGIHPANTQLRQYAVKIENDTVWVDVDQVIAERSGPGDTQPGEPSDGR